MDNSDLCMPVLCITFFYVFIIIIIRIINYFVNVGTVYDVKCMCISYILKQ